MRRIDPDRTLALRFPTVAAQWHPTRNPATTTPQNTAGQSALRVWWRCLRGHEWQETVSGRVSTIPRWKNDDPAACRWCSPSADTLVMHTFGCGHTVRVTLHTALKDAPRCWPCEQPLHDQRRRQERAAASRALPARVAPAATPQQRRAQRRLVAVLNRQTIIDPQGVSVLRDETLAWAHNAASTDDVASWLRLLGIPHTVVPVAPPDGGPGPANLLRVAWTDLPYLRLWAPTAADKAARYHKNAGGDS